MARRPAPTKPLTAVVVIPDDAPRTVEGLTPEQAQRGIAGWATVLRVLMESRASRLTAAAEAQAA